MSEAEQRAYIFNPGPTVLPEKVLLQAQSELLNVRGTGQSVLELSHRSAAFARIIEDAERDLRALLAIPARYKVLFVQGGGNTQFAAVYLNMMRSRSVAARKQASGIAESEQLPVDYLVTGTWSKKAAEEARMLGAKVNVVCDPSKSDGGFHSLPDRAKWSLSGSRAAYVYYCDNETVQGVEFPDSGSVADSLPGEQDEHLRPVVVCDMSSNILTRPVDVSKFGIIFAGAQKNMGPAGVTIVIVREDLLETVGEEQLKAHPLLYPALPTMLDYNTMAKTNSLYNTPPTFSIYVCGLMYRWMLDENGGIQSAAEKSAVRSAQLYRILDRSSVYKPVVAQASARSRVNVTFTLASAELEKAFLEGAKARRLEGIKGHRSVGGIRISLYNGVTDEALDVLVSYMLEFQEQH